MQRSEIETAVTELLANISGIQPGQIARDLRFEKLGLDFAFQNRPGGRGRRSLRYRHTG